MTNKIFPLLDGEPICTRAKLDTGTSCNYNCTFCYYKDKLDIETSFDIIKERIQYLRECGITEVDLSGGESSYHPDWFKILDECKGLYISTISNGSMFTDYEFIKKSKEHGLKEIMFTITGYDKRMHDKITQNPGAFDDLMKSILNSKKLGLVIRINYVVTLNSLGSEEYYINLINQLEPLEINFLTLNHFGVAKQSLSYEKSTNHIKKIIDGITTKYINVRYTPYCYMVGYEKYVCNTFQHIYDLFDWNMAIYNQRISPDKYLKDPRNALYERAKHDRNTMYYKPEQCIGCKYLALCDGLENGCSDEVHPETGKIIKEINYYRKGFYENKCSDINTQ